MSESEEALELAKAWFNFITEVGEDIGRYELCYADLSFESSVKKNIYSFDVDEAIMINDIRIDEINDLRFYDEHTKKSFGLKEADIVVLERGDEGEKYTVESIVFSAFTKHMGKWGRNFYDFSAKNLKSNANLKKILNGADLFIEQFETIVAKKEKYKQVENYGIF